MNQSEDSNRCFISPRVSLVCLFHLALGKWLPPPQQGKVDRAMLEWVGHDVRQFSWERRFTAAWELIETMLRLMLGVSSAEIIRNVYISDTEGSTHPIWREKPNQECGVSFGSGCAKTEDEMARKVNASLASSTPRIRGISRRYSSTQFPIRKIQVWTSIWVGGTFSITPTHRLRLN